MVYIVDVNPFSTQLEHFMMLSLSLNVLHTARQVHVPR